MRTARNSGFTLIELVVVMVIIAVLISMAAAMTRGLSEAARRSTTSKAVGGTEASLVNFVMIAKRLPCPADGALAADDPAAGREMRNATAPGSCTTQARGVVPWVTLGVKPSEAIDGYGNLLTYRVAPDLVADGAMDFTLCDAAGGDGSSTSQGAAMPGNPGTCASPCPYPAPTVLVPHPIQNTTYCTAPRTATINRGIVVKDGGSNLVMDPATSRGAAYVVISHGTNQSRAYSAQGGLNPGIGDVGAGELQNDGSLDLQPFYVDAEVATGAGTAFDDVLSRPAILTVAGQAGLAPRTHAVQ